MFVCRSCCSPACSFNGTTCVTVTGCGLPLPGTAVSLIQGGTTISSGTTTGQVTSIAVTSGGGTGYTSAPTVGLSGGGGSGAAALAVLGVSGNVSAVFITAYGTGYTSAPTVSFSGGGGSGATATATIAARACLAYAATGTTTLQVTGPTGTGYSTTPTNSTVTILSCNSPGFTVTVAPDASHSCSKACCPNSDYPATPPYLTSIHPPSTIFCTDPFGTVTMSNGGSGNTWTGCAIRTAAHAVEPPPNCATVLTGQSVTVGFTLTCTSAGTFILDLDLDYQGCSGSLFPTAGGTCVHGTTGLNCNATQTNTFTTPTCSPISGTMTMSFAGIPTCTSQAPVFEIYGSSATFTFSS